MSISQEIGPKFCTHVYYTCDVFWQWFLGLDADVSVNFVRLSGNDTDSQSAIRFLPVWHNILIADDTCQRILAYAGAVGLASRNSAGRRLSLSRLEVSDK